MWISDGNKQLINSDYFSQIIQIQDKNTETGETVFRVGFCKDNEVIAYSFVDFDDGFKANHAVQAIGNCIKEGKPYFLLQNADLSWSIPTKATGMKNKTEE